MNRSAELYEAQWTPDDRERKAIELAQRFHGATEAYDRLVCTGPVRDGSIMPANHREFGLINRNARMVLDALYDEAKEHGITPVELWRAIRKTEGR